MHTVKCRLFEPRLRPRRTKMDVPGWAGKPEPRKDGSHEYAWHCVPFSESAQYGIELFYPFDNELRVTTRDRRLILDGDFGPNPGTGVEWPPFRTFGEQLHRLRSSSANIGARGLCEMCLAWGEITSENLTGLGETKLEELHKEYQRVRGALEGRLCKCDSTAGSTESGALG